MSQGDIGPIGILQPRDKTGEGDFQVDFTVEQMEEGAETVYTIQAFDRTKRREYTHYLEEVSEDTFIFSAAGNQGTVRTNKNTQHNMVSVCN